jgi:hypothetical protein
MNVTVCKCSCHFVMYVIFCLVVILLSLSFSDTFYVPCSFAYFLFLDCCVLSLWTFIKTYIYVAYKCEEFFDN